LEAFGGSTRNDSAGVRPYAKAMAKVDYWGIGLMLIGVALALWVGKLVGAICGIVGLALIVWGEVFKQKRKEHSGGAKDDQIKFVMEVAGTPPLSSTDWKFLLTNCGARAVRYAQLSTIRSEIGAYEICFKEIPFLQAGNKVTVDYEVIPRREDDRDNMRRATLLDFGKDHAGERGHTYLWYDISIQYRDADDSIRDGGVVSVCFDLAKQILKTEGADYWRKNRAIWQAGLTSRGSSGS